MFLKGFETDEEVPCESIEEIMKLTKEWLHKNDRLTFQTIFQGMDYSKTGELGKDAFESCFRRIGIYLHPSEISILADCLDRRGIE
jgi:Ca2+-binding EF-hand superfamily protein